MLVKHNSAMQGVYTIADLRNLFMPSSKVELYRRIQGLLDNHVLYRFCNTIYVTEDFSLEAVSCRINPQSYISCGNVLSRHLLIGVRPQKAVTAIKVGRSREYGGELGTVVHLGIASHLMFGYDFQEGIRRADMEKAYLDTLYFHQKGHRFSFDVLTDIDAPRLDRSRVLDYLNHYRNPRFKRFVENCLADGD